MEGLISQGGDLGPVEEIKADEFPDLTAVQRRAGRELLFSFSPLHVQ